MAGIDMLITVGGIIYGSILIYSCFTNQRWVQIFRLDTFFTSRPTANTRLINLAFGLFVLITSLYSLLD